MLSGRLKTWLILTGLTLISGCAGVISDPVVKQVNKSATLKAVISAPGTYTGQMVLWSGEIIRTENKKEGTLIEIIQKPEGFNHRPQKADRTDGRFLALFDGYLDTAIYEKGREVTIAGKISGRRTLPLGEIDYAYPLVKIEEVHLWPVREPQIHLHDYHRPYLLWHYPYPGYYHW